MSSIDVPINPQEAGYPEGAPDLANLILPPGGGRAGLPHVTKFSSIVNLASRTHRWTSDEALRDSETNSKAVAREPVIWEAVRARQYPTVQMSWHIAAVNKKRPEEQEAAFRVEEMIKRTYYFQQWKRQHLDATWFGKSATNAAWEWDYSSGVKALRVRNWWPIRGDKIVWKFSGAMGIRVWGGFKAADHGLLGDTCITDKGLAYFPCSAERPAYVVHRFEPEDADFFDPELAGSVYGSGVRGRIYWLWHQRTQVLAWMLDYLELVGAGGFTIFYYTAGNPASMAEVEALAEQQLRNHVILFPRFAQKETGGPGIERIEPGVAGTNLLKELITDYYDAVIRRYIVGPFLSSEVNSSGMGMGEGTSDLLVGPFARIVKYDCTDLGETYSAEWLPTYYRACYPHLPVGRFEFDVDKPNAAELAEAANVFYEMGGDLDAEHLRDALGLPEPDPDGGILAKAQPMSVQGVGPDQAMPEGIPSEGVPGPVAAPNGEQMKLHRLKLSRRNRQNWWNSLPLGQKCDVLGQVVSDLLRKRDRDDEPIRKSASRGVEAGMRIEVPTINVNVDAPQLTCPAPEIHVAAPQITVEAPQVNVEAPQVKVAAPKVSVAAPQLHVDAPQIKVSVAAPQLNVEMPELPELPEPPAQPEGKEKTLQVIRDAQGNITGARVVANI